MSIRLNYLYERIVDASATPEEQQEFRRLIQQPENEALVREMLAMAYREPRALTDISDDTALTMLQAIFSADLRQGVVAPLQEDQKIRRITRKWWAVAASVVVLLLGGAYYWYIHEHNIHSPALESVKQDIPPGGNKATLTLAGGSTITLDSAANGTLAQQGSVKIVKLSNGQLAYEGKSNVQPVETIYNTLTTPRGGQYQLILPDGSKVWLDAASSIKYPTAFTGRERRVEINGQAYLEIVHNAKMPFMVSVGGIEIRDIGTSFNINSYETSNVMVTLVEGSVELKRNAAKVLLKKPSQQAQVKAEHIDVVNDPDMEATLAWKNGKFMFGERADIETIMDQVARWYDVEIEYQGKVNAHFGGTISRQVNVSKLLEKLEITGEVHFKIDGRKVIVMP